MSRGEVGVLAKSVETQYGDNWYPSRLAARWAVFFDLLGIRFQHRPITWTLTELGNREWTPDFLLPDLRAEIDDADSRSKTLLVLRERPASKWDIETVAHYLKCELSEHAYIFSGLPTEHGLAVFWLSDNRTYEVDFAQCPFCGEFFIRQFKDSDSGREYYRGHYGCIAEEQYAERLDIDPSFMDFTDRYQVVPLPNSSPMLQIARMAARKARFESKEYAHELRGVARSLEVLKQSRYFASVELTRFIESHGEAMAKEERCPRFSPSPRYVHFLHKKSGKTAACPCTRCESEKVNVSKSQLSEMKAPDTRM